MPIGSASLWAGLPVPLGDAVMLIVDGHVDPAYNALVDGRDYLRSALDIRDDEVDGPVPEINGLCMLGLPEWLAGGVAISVVTLTAIPRTHAHAGELGYPNAEGAFQTALAQLAIYRRWAERHPQVDLVTDQHQLDAVLANWLAPVTPDHDPRRVGLVLLIENADVIREPTELGFWYEQGVRLVGPAWAANRYTGSTNDGGPLTSLGRELITEMDRLSLALDLSHMSDLGIAEALEIFGGTVVASHANPRALVPMQRNLSDEVIRQIAGRDGVIGIMPLNWALDPTWTTHKDKTRVPIDRVIDAIDHVCQLTGDADHVGIGSDFDGGQGAETAPDGIDTVADLPRIADALGRRGYDALTVEAIMGGNWLRVLRRHFPERT